MLVGFLKKEVNGDISQHMDATESLIHKS
jgi:hypothetical protein